MNGLLHQSLQHLLDTLSDYSLMHWAVGTFCLTFGWEQCFCFPMLSQAFHCSEQLWSRRMVWVKCRSHCTAQALLIPRAQTANLKSSTCPTLLFESCWIAHVRVVVPNLYILPNSLPKFFMRLKCDNQSSDAPWSDPFLSSVSSVAMPFISYINYINAFGGKPHQPLQARCSLLWLMSRLSVGIIGLRFAGCALQRF